MFVYERKNQDLDETEICIALEGNKPVETPDFVIRLQKDQKTLIINDTEVVAPKSSDEE